MIYPVRYIQYKNRKCPILIQSVNGPCPLLAIANVLLLRGSITLYDGCADISFSHLSSLLTDYLQKRITEITNKAIDRQKQSASSVDSEIANILQNHDDALRVLPQLEQGLDINVQFKSPSAFEFTAAVGMFDLYDIRLVHGWCVDPHEEVYKIIAKWSYNEAVNFIAIHRSQDQPSVAHAAPPSPPHSSSSSSSIEEKSIPPPSVEVKVERSGKDEVIDLPSSPSSDASIDNHSSSSSVAPFNSPIEEKKSASPPAHDLSSHLSSLKLSNPDAELVRVWLDDTCGQLTHHGLSSLFSLLDDGELSILFRNNHFSVLLKSGSRMYALVTDEGLIGAVPYLTWTILSDVGGDEAWVDDQLRLITPESIANYIRQPPPQPISEGTGPPGLPLPRAHQQPAMLRPQQMYAPIIQPQQQTDHHHPEAKMQSQPYPASAYPTYPNNPPFADASAAAAASHPLPIVGNFAMLDGGSLAVAVPAGVDVDTFQRRLIADQALELQQAKEHAKAHKEREELERREYERLAEAHRKKLEKAKRKKSDPCLLM